SDHFDRARLREMARAPVANGGDDRNKTFTFTREPVLDLRRHDAVILAVDQPRSGQRLRFAAEHAGRDFRGAACAAQQAGSYLAIASGTMLQIPDDAQLVLAADHLLERRHRAAAG